MEAKNLRIGNLVLDKDGNIFAIAGVLESSVLKKDAHIGTPIEWIKTIPLTEEHLLDFGFKLISETKIVYSKGRLQIEKIGDSFIETRYGINLKYIHKLQNVYFLIENKELTK